MWQDETFSEIQMGDIVWYETPQGLQANGKAKIRGPEGWVLDTVHGVKVVNDGYNYLGHTPAKNRKPDHLGEFLHGI
tara:strand:- start:393 stop:623 length:231 start_codon:yes stop_codon:yes gene_type:complete